MVKHLQNSRFMYFSKNIFEKKRNIQDGKAFTGVEFNYL